MTRFWIPPSRGELNFGACHYPLSPIWNRSGAHRAPALQLTLSQRVRLFADAGVTHFYPGRETEIYPGRETESKRQKT